MTKYRLTVVEVAELTEEERRSCRIGGYHSMDVSPMGEVAHVRTLEIEITPDEWQKVKRAVLEVM